MHVLIATDATWVDAEVRAALDEPGTTFVVCRDGRAVPTAVTQQLPDIAVLDLQIGSMGGMAVAMAARLDESSGRMPPLKLLMLLDRAADVHLARRCGADGWLVKPLDALRLRRAVRTILDGGTVTEGVPAAPNGDAEAESVSELTAEEPATTG